MRYFYQDQNHEWIGPYMMEELRQLHLNGIVKPDTPTMVEGGNTTVLFKDLWSKLRIDEQAGSSPTPPTSAAATSFVESFTQKARADLRALIPHLLMPWDELSRFHWMDNRRLLCIAGIGLFPLLIIACFSGSNNLKGAYWAIAFYFSILWALFFYYVFPTPKVDVSTCVICFFGTGLISVAVLSLVCQIPPLSHRSVWITAPYFLSRFAGFLLGVGLPEETCKVLILYYLWRRLEVVPPQTILFYGLISGLGFGIYEGVDYQTRFNWFFSRFNAAEYYLLNLIRLTTLPFLHAIWTGIAGYFIGFARLYPERRTGLLMVAIGVPTLLHGCYDAFGNSLSGLGFALLSVLALVLYLAKSVDFENALRELNPDKTA